MSKSSNAFFSVIGIAIGYLIARKVDSNTEHKIKDFVQKKSGDIVDEAKEIINNNSELIEVFKEKLEALSSDIDEKLDIIKKMMEETSTKSEEK